MTRIQLLERCLRIGCFTVLGVLALLVLAACGPGSGGTGTGPIASYTTASVSGGAAPGGPTGPGGAGPMPSNPNVPACGRVDVQIEDARVEVTSLCGSFTFVGNWSAGGAATDFLLPGTLVKPDSGVPVAATLRLNFNDSIGTSTHVTLTIIDASGQALLGPQILTRVDALPPR